MSLYLKYRPTTFDEVYGQDEAVALLKSIVAMPKADRPKVYLFGGASGCGKGTLAGVFARALNVNPTSSDFRTMDASKDRSIDNIRDLCDMMGVRPMSPKADGRIFLIDECFDYNTPITCVADDGSLFTERIGSIVNGRKQYKVLSYSSDGVLEAQPITGWFENRKKPLKNYTFKRDVGRGAKYSIACSDNHVIFMADGTEKPAEELKIGDKVKVVMPWKPKYETKSRKNLGCYSISKEAYSFLLGTALGDTTMQKGRSINSAPRFRLIHGLKQEAYFHAKVRLFGDAMGRYRVIENKGYGDFLISGHTKSLQDFEQLYNLLYSDGKLRLTKEVAGRIDAIALAALYCDDGSWSPSKYTTVGGDLHVGYGSCALATHSLTKEENEILRNHIADKFGVNMRLTRHKDTDMWYLVSRTTKDTQKFMEIVAPWMPECMQYKVHNEITVGDGMSKIKPITFRDPGFEGGADLTTATLVDISDERKYQTMRGHLYDIEVAKNHNYVAGGVVVHNCHQLLLPAQEAMLKKCEDTPPATYVIFATTEPEKLGKALRSRCKFITIKPMTPKALYMNLKRVASAEGIKVSDEDLQKIANNSDNSARVSLQILENYALNGNNVDKAISMNGGIGDEMKADTITLCRAIVSRSDDWPMVVDFCSKYKGQSEPVRQAILGYLKACLLKSRNRTERVRFASLIECFLEPHYDCGDAALVYQIATSFEVK